MRRDLVDAYRGSFGVHEDEAMERVLSAIRFTYVHGSLGRLPNESRPTLQDRAYSRHRDGESLPAAARGIIVLSEADKTSEEFTAAHEHIGAAERVVFLGSAYHPENLTRLGLQEHRGTSDGQELWGSGFEMTGVEAGAVKARWGISAQNRAWKTLEFLRETGALD